MTLDYTLSNNDANTNSHSSVKEAEMHREEVIHHKYEVSWLES